jgi:4-hydroxy-4-methyl-2-oxoglutarate aldolase
MADQDVARIGFRVYREMTRPPRDIIDALAQIPTPDLADVMYGTGAMSSEIRAAYTPMPRIAGPAVTVSLPTGSFPMLKMGMQQTEAGDILVVNARAASTYAVWGGNISLGMARRGVKGIVIDGYARDVPDIQATGLPLFCRGSVANICPLQGPGEVNVPIACGTTVVNPGDIIVADEEGVVVVPRGAARSIVQAAHDLHERHMKVQPILQRGEVTNIDNIERAFREEGCQIV